MPDTLEAPTTASESNADSQVSQGAPATGVRPSSFRPPNPAFERAAQGIRNRAAKAAGVTLPEPKITPPRESTPAPDPGATSPKPSDETANAKSGSDESGEGEATPGQDDAGRGEETAKTAEPAPDAKGKKVSPWKLVEQYKKSTKEWQTKAEAIEAELTKARSGAPPQAQTQELQQRLEATEKRLKEYEDEIRYKAFEKSEAFQKNYAKPYEEAWKRATAMLSEITITDPATGSIRTATADDMLALLNLPLSKAREYADQNFGSLANDVMADRKEIKRLFEQQQAALKEAREKGSEHEKQLQQQVEAQHAAIRKELTETWSSANQEILADPNEAPYLKASDTDPEGKKILEKGFALIDKAFAMNPNDPRMTPEQRREAVKLHSAMRNRAAAYGHMKHLIKARDARIGELEKLLEEFGASEPSTTGGSTKTSKPSEPAKFEERFKSRLQKMAH